MIQPALMIYFIKRSSIYQEVCVTQNRKIIGSRREEILRFFDNMETYMKENRPTKNPDSRKVKPAFYRKHKGRLPTVVATNHTVAQPSE